MPTIPCHLCYHSDTLHVILDAPAPNYPAPPEQQLYVNGSRRPGIWLCLPGHRNGGKHGVLYLQDFRRTWLTGFVPVEYMNPDFYFSRAHIDQNAAGGFPLDIDIELLFSQTFN